MRAILLAVLMMGAGTARADDFSDFTTWMKAQAGQTGISVGTKDKAKYAAQVWDALSYGQKGMDVFAAGALDYVDLGPAWAIANDRAPRYGICAPIHAGNIWDTARTHLPPAVGTHVHTTKLPDFSVSGIFLWPTGGSVRGWRWDRDFMVYFSYKYGGAAAVTAP